jgi:hypothetical protein
MALAVEEAITRLLLSSLSMEASRGSAMFADMDIVSLRAPGCGMELGGRLTEIWTRSTGNGKAARDPRPAYVARTADGQGVTGGITSNG